MSHFNRLHGGQALHDRAWDAKDAFKSNNPNGAFDDTFIEFVKSLREDDYYQLNNLFKHMSDGMKINITNKVRRDRGGMSYLWATVPLGMGDEGVKIPGDSRVLHLVSNYRAGKVKINFDLDDLVDHMLS